MHLRILYRSVVKQDHNKTHSTGSFDSSVRYSNLTVTVYTTILQQLVVKGLTESNSLILNIRKLVIQ